MKIPKIVLVLLVMQIFTGQFAADAETIYTKDGGVITAKISEKAETIIWYELSAGDDIVEYSGIDIADVEKIVNDDGSVSEYSPTYTPPAE